MTARYSHTQRGTLMLVILPIAAIMSASLGYFNPSAPGRLMSLAIAIGCAILAWLFSSLTVAVSADDVRWYFGPGFWKYRIARDEIANSHIVRNEWWHGFGIRRRPSLRLYNVSGLDAVELHLRNGDIRRIGTDDAPGLAAALRS